MRVLITGMSGTGKSSVLRELARLGHRVVDTDDGGWLEPVVQPDGSVEDLWRADAVTALLRDHRGGALFVGGCCADQGAFYRWFDHVVLLSAPAEVLLARVTSRTTNPYGSTSEERAEIMANLTEVEPLLRASATIEVDTRASLTEVVRRLDTLIRGRHKDHY